MRTRDVRSTFLEVLIGGQTISGRRWYRGKLQTFSDKLWLHILFSVYIKHNDIGKSKSSSVFNIFQKSTHVDTFLSPRAVSLPHVSPSVAFFPRNSWRLKLLHGLDGQVQSIWKAAWLCIAYSSGEPRPLMTWHRVFLSSQHFLIRFDPLTFCRRCCRWISAASQRKELAVFEIVKCSVLLPSAMIIYNEPQLSTEFHWSISIHDGKIASHC